MTDKQTRTAMQNGEKYIWRTDVKNISLNFELHADVMILSNKTTNTYMALCIDKGTVLADYYPTKDELISAIVELNPHVRLDIEA